MFLKKDLIFRTNLMQSDVPIAKNISPLEQHESISPSFLPENTGI